MSCTLLQCGLFSSRTPIDLLEPPSLTDPFAKRKSSVSQTPESNSRCDRPSDIFSRLERSNVNVNKEKKVTMYDEAGTIKLASSYQKPISDCLAVSGPAPASSVSAS